MKVVTSGYKLLDIDAYACCVAYAELLNLLGEEAVAASSAPLNASVTEEIRSWPATLRRDYKSSPDDVYVIVDLSDPEFFDSFVSESQIDEIIDHHANFVDFWQPKLGDKAQIEFIGAACTLVFERWMKAGKFADISETSARLLVAGILDNTLNFKAQVTTDRDHAAYKKLLERANLSADWAAKYFTDCQQSILADLPGAIGGDAKGVKLANLSQPITIGQLAVWDGSKIVNERREEVQSTMQGIDNRWVMNVVSISEGYNYLIASDQQLESYLEELLNVKFIDSVAITDRLWLRKEIVLAGTRYLSHGASQG